MSLKIFFVTRGAQLSHTAPALKLLRQTVKKKQEQHTEIIQLI